MTDMNVIVIGTDPPCPRCDLVFRLVEAAAAAGLGIHVEQCAFDSSLARQIGARLGRKVGTAKHVARDVGIAMDWDAVLINGNVVHHGGVSAPEQVAAWLSGTQAPAP